MVIVGLNWSKLAENELKLVNSWIAKGWEGSDALSKLTFYIYITIYTVLSHVCLAIGIICQLFGVTLFNMKSY